MGRGGSTVRHLASSALIGTATGYLSQVGLATLVTVTPERQLPAFARSPWIRRLSFASATGEMFANAFISSLPSRTDPQALGGRIAFGAGSAALLALTRRRNIVVPLIVGGTSAAIAAKVAHDQRAALSRHVPDPLVGLAENAVAVGLAVAATRQ